MRASQTPFISFYRWVEGETLRSSSLSLLLIRISEKQRSEGRKGEWEIKSPSWLWQERRAPLKQSHYETQAVPLAQRVLAVSLWTLGCVSFVPLW